MNKVTSIIEAENVGIDNGMGEDVKNAITANTSHVVINVRVTFNDEAKAMADNNIYVLAVAA